MDAKVEQPTAAADVDYESTSEGPPPEQLEEEFSFEHTLKRPIEAHGEEVRILKWREPTGGDIERAGNPITIEVVDGRTSMGFNEKKMTAMISLLAAIPPSSVRKITAGDWNAIAIKLVRFFTPTGL
jgi:hypothetical protein